MHCSADLSDDRTSADDDGDGFWDQDTADGEVTSPAGDESGELLPDDGVVDNTLTVLVGIGGGIFVGVVGTAVLAALSGSWWSLPVGFVAWLGSTAYLVRRRTVQGAVAKTGYAVAVVLLLIPLVVLSPVFDVDGGLAGRAELFGAWLLFVVVPAGIAAVVGWIASQFVPDDAGGSEG